MTVGTSESENCPWCNVIRAPLRKGGWCSTCGWNPKHSRELRDLQCEVEQLKASSRKWCEAYGESGIDIDKLKAESAQMETEFNRKVDECAALRREVETLADVSKGIIEGLELDVKRLKAAHNGEVCVDTMEYCDKLKADNARLREALDTIAGGHITRFPGAPALTEDVNPLAWRSDMWDWSQRVAEAALATGEKDEDG